MVNSAFTITLIQYFLLLQTLCSNIDIDLLSATKTIFSLLTKGLEILGTFGHGPSEEKELSSGGLNLDPNFVEEAFLNYSLLIQRSKFKSDTKKWRSSLNESIGYEYSLKIADLAVLIFKNFSVVGEIFEVALSKLLSLVKEITTKGNIDEKAGVCVCVCVC